MTLRPTFLKRQSSPARSQAQRRLFSLESLESRALLSATAEFTLVNDWGDGFQGEIALVNGETATTSWQLEFDFSRQITQMWNAAFVSHTGNHYVISNVSWNASLDPQEPVTIGFLGEPGNLTSGPTNFVFNGVPIGATSGPNLSVADVSTNEPDASNTTATFVVTLSAATATPVTVNFATSNGTAQAGSDYLAKSGAITFAPGEVQKTINVTVLGDTIDEANETYSVVLSSPTGASLARGTAQGTIIDNDAAPSVSIADATVYEPTGGIGATSGFFHTSGNQILNAANQPIKIAGVSWFGLETDTFSPHGLWSRNWKSMMDQMVAEGFNTIRLPYSNQLFDAGSVPNGIDFSLNPDLQGLNGLGIMDKIVSYAGQIGLRIMLDHHRSDAGASANENGLWYTDAYPESRWISDWTMLAQRYAGNSTVFAADLHNEPHGPANWGAGGASDWRLAAERAGNAILAVNPDWLIVVEGVENASSGPYWWGGNLSNAGSLPVRLNVSGRLVYSPHDYPKSVYAQDWFDAANYPNNLPGIWDQNWGYLFKQGIAPILLGEFGTKFSTTSDQLWLDKLVDYLGGDLDGNGTNDLPAGQLGMSWTYWSWNPNSGDTGGILQNDWQSIQRAKVDAIKPIQFDIPDVTPNPTSNASIKVTLSAASGQTVTVNYATQANTATAGADYFATSGTLTFAPGETQKTIQVPIVGDGTAEPAETFRLVLSSPNNVAISRSTATVTILDSSNRPGDANGDGFVDGSDYTVWADNYLKSTTLGRVAADFNYDGKTDAADYVIWADNFAPKPAAAVTAPAASSVPVASSASLTESQPKGDVAVGQSAETRRAILLNAVAVDTLINAAERDGTGISFLLRRFRERR